MHSRSLIFQEFFDLRGCSTVSGPEIFGEEVTYAQYGKGKEGSYQTQVGLIVLLGHRTRMPVLFRILPGNITDVTTVQDMLFRFDEINDSRRVFAAVLDRGYCSLDNLAQFIDKQSRVIVAAKTSYRWVQESIKEVLPRLWLNETRISGQQCWGATHSLLHRFPDGKNRRMWVHVYRSDLISHTENTRFYSSLEAFETQWNSCKKSGDGNEAALLKSPLLKYYKKMSGKQLQPGIDELVRDDWAIDQAVRYFGCFCNVTTFPCTAADALLEYTLRDSIEKCFKAGKSCVELDTIRSHNDQTTEGRFVVSFCCMTILNELHRRMKLETFATVGTEARKLPPLTKEMTWNEIRNYMSGIRMVYDGKADGGGWKSPDASMPLPNVWDSRMPIGSCRSGGLSEDGAGDVSSCYVHPRKNLDVKKTALRSEAAVFSLMPDASQSSMSKPARRAARSASVRFVAPKAR